MAIYLFQANTNRTSDLARDSLVIKNQIQQRADTISYDIMGGTAPQEWDDIKCYKGTTIAAVAGTTLTLDPHFQTGVSFFHVGQKLRIRIGDSDEETVEVLTYDEDTLQLVLVAAPSGSITVGDKIGEQFFGGTMLAPKTVNVEYAANVEYQCSGTDYTKLFDKKNISDTWEDVDSRYIINDFCNTTVNYCRTVDNLYYVDNSAVQGEWLEGGDGGNPTVDTADFLESLGSSIFTWTFSSGTAYWEGTPTAADYSDFVGASSGTPVEGFLMLWCEPADYTKITAIKVRIGSSNANYAEVTLDKPISNDWQYLSGKFVNATITGTPDWTAVDYVRIIITQTASSSVKLNGLRVNHDSSFTLKNVQPTPTYDDFRAPRAKPTALMQLLASTWEYIWYIDYQRDIHFMPMETEAAPWDADNYNVMGLDTSVDASQLGNRIQVEGGEEISVSTYAQVFQGDNVLREWLLKGKFSNLSITVDNGSSAHAAEVGTNTTNIKITAHGLATGDHVVNRTRAVSREITRVDADNFTVEAVPSQTNGDNITFFSVSKTDGIEGIDDEASFNYMANSNEKSVRSSSTEATLTTSDYIRFAYNERVPIQLEYLDSASADMLKAMGLGDGVFDLEAIIDQSIDSRALAIAIAQAKVSTYSNPTISGNYKTDRHGIRAGMIQRVVDSYRSFDAEHVIQTVAIKQRGGEFSDNFQFTVNFGTTLFGWIEFMQKLLALQGNIEVNADAIVAIFVTANETVEASDVNQVATDGGFLTVSSAETVESSEANTVAKLTTGTWRYEPNGVGQTFESRFNLCDFG